MDETKSDNGQLSTSASCYHLSSIVRSESAKPCYIVTSRRKVSRCPVLAASTGVRYTWILTVTIRYWLNNTLGAQIVLVQPSRAGFAAIQKQMETRKINDYDMEVINAVYGESCAILPHRPYNLLSGEFRSTSHTAYLGTDDEPWDAEKVVQEAKYIHFSDWYALDLYTSRSLRLVY